VDVCLVIKRRLEELGLEQRDLAAAAHVTESYISQLLTRRKAPPAVDRTDLYERMNDFLKLPKGQLSAIVRAQRAEELKKKLADPPLPLFKEVRALVINKCRGEAQSVIRDIFAQQAFGELERLVTQTLLNVTKKIARDELKEERWLRAVARARKLSYEEARGAILEFLDTDVYNVSPEHCSAFLDPLIESWTIDLETFEMAIALNRQLSTTASMNFKFVETASIEPAAQLPGFREFIGNATLSGDASREELAFLSGLRFAQRAPTALYFYRELQNLRDPLHFPGSSVGAMHKHRDASDVEKKLQVDSRRKALRRWSNKVSKKLVKS